MFDSMSADDRKKFARAGLTAMSALQSRAGLAAALGKSFAGKRDLYSELGYPLDIQFESYEAKYKRQDLAGRIIDLPAQDTWRTPPTIKDGDADDTDFVKAIISISDRLKLWHYMERVDRLAGIGKYGVLLIGVKDTKKLSDPIEDESLTDSEDVIFLSAFDEGSASVETLDASPASERFGMVHQYEINLGDRADVAGTGQHKTHWSRVIHVADDLLEDEINGRPRLERVFNRLEDIEKIVGGGAEAIWRLIYQGMILTTQEDYTKGTEAGEETVTDDELDEFIHGFRRVLELEGFNVQFVGGETVDPTGMFGILLSLIAGETGIPQRMLVGSERGELASTTDQATWAGRIEARQTRFAEPMILRPFIDRLIKFGALPKPKNETYTVHWEPTFKLNELEEAELASKVGTALQAVAPPGAVDLIVDPAVFIRAYLPKLIEGIQTVGGLLTEEETDNLETHELLAFFRGWKERQTHTVD